MTKRVEDVEPGPIKNDGWPRRPLVWAALLVGAVAAAAAVLIGPVFLVNDDGMMMLTSMGYYTAGRPSPYLVFINILPGRVLAGLYGLAPSLPWYSILLWALNGASLVAVAWCLLRSRRRLAVVATACAPLGFGFVVMTRLTYTVTAAAAAAAAVALLVASARETRRGRWAFEVAAVAFAAAGAMLRWQAFLMVGGLGLPVLAVLALGRREWRLAAVGAVVVAAAAGAQIYHVRVYDSDPAWARFRAFNSARARLHDYPVDLDARVVDAACREVGWKPTRFALFREWFFADTPDYATEKVRRLAEALARRRTTREGFEVLLDAVRRNVAGWATLALLAAIVYVRGPALARLALTALLLAGGAGIAYLAFFAKLPYRVSLPLCFAMAALSAMLATAPTRAAPRARRRWRRVLVIALLAVLALRCVEVVGLVQSGSAARSVWRRILRAIPRGDDRLYVAWDFPWALIPPGATLKDFSGLRTLPGGWMQMCPCHAAMLREFRVKDVGRALLERDDVFLIARENHLLDFNNYAADHYGWRLAFEPPAVLRLTPFERRFPLVNYWDRIFVGRVRPRTRVRSAW